MDPQIRRWILGSAAESAADCHSAVDPSFGGGFGGGFVHSAVDSAVDFAFGGGSGNPLPKFGGEDPLGKM